MTASITGPFTQQEEIRVSASGWITSKGAFAKMGRGPEIKDAAPQVTQEVRAHRDPQCAGCETRSRT